MKAVFYLSCLVFCYMAKGQYYHNTNVITASGDTINKQDASKLYHGYHVLTDNSKNLFSDANLYKAGYFEHGAPKGLWIEHQADGTYAQGQYEQGQEYVYDVDTKQYVMKNNGTGAKTGVWIYYKKDSTVLEKVRYQREIKKKEKIEAEFTENEKGEYILTRYVSQPTKGLKAKLESKTEHNYSIHSHLTDCTHSNVYQDIEKSYYPNGNVRLCTTSNHVTNRSVETKYTRQGKKYSRTTVKRWDNRVQGCPKFR